MDGKPEAFVEEIIRHSGLLSDAGRKGLWHYAHRSIQEFLAAQELRLNTDDRFLLTKAEALSWRQVTQFYTVGQEARQVDHFSGNSPGAIQSLRSAAYGAQGHRSLRRKRS